MKFSKNIMVAIAVASALIGTTIIAPNIYAENQKCPAGSVQANKEIGKDGESLNSSEKDENGNYKSSGKTGKIASLAQCNLDADALKEKPLMERLSIIINVILSVLGIVAVIVIILGGFTYITSNGDAAKVTKGKNIILYGVIGLVVALLAFAIVNFVLGSVFNS